MSGDAMNDVTPDTTRYRVTRLEQDIYDLRQQIRTLEEKNDAEFRRLWNHINNMPGGI